MGARPRTTSQAQRAGMFIVIEPKTMFLSRPLRGGDSESERQMIRECSAAESGKRLIQKIIFALVEKSRFLNGQKKRMDIG